MNYLIALLVFVALCAGWAVFQVWLSRHDADAMRRLNKCGNCGCDGASDCKRAQT